MRLYTAITDDGFVSDETKAKIAGTVSTSGWCHLGDSSDTILPDVRR